MRKTRLLTDLVISGLKDQRTWSFGVFREQTRRDSTAGGPRVHREAGIGESEAGGFEKTRYLSDSRFGGGQRTDISPQFSEPPRRSYTRFAEFAESETSSGLWRPVFLVILVICGLLWGVVVTETRLCGCGRVLAVCGLFAGLYTLSCGYGEIANAV